MRNQRLARVQALAADEVLPQLRKQTIQSGALGDVPYCRQGDELGLRRGARLCVNACFRMVFGAITGWRPSEHVLAVRMLEHRGDVVVPDEEYFKLFQTEIFQEICDKKIRVVETVGADLAMIGKLATSLRERQGATLYPILSLGSKTVEADVWHADVLLAADDQCIVVQDPSCVNGAPNKMIQKDEFAARWAIAYNRAQLVIVQP